MHYQSDKILYDLASKLGQLLKKRACNLATAESCTGGWIAKVITDVPGSSHWFERGFITYSNQAKQETLGVNAQTLQIQGAVSQQTVLEMAKGSLLKSSADLSVAVTGIAGPEGGSSGKPVGTVWIGYGFLLSTKPSPDYFFHAENYLFSGDRYVIREKTVIVALFTLITILDSI